MQRVLLPLESYSKSADVWPEQNFQVLDPNEGLLKLSHNLLALNSYRLHEPALNTPNLDKTNHRHRLGNQEALGLILKLQNIHPAYGEQRPLQHHTEPLASRFQPRPKGIWHLTSAQCMARIDPGSCSFGQFLAHNLPRCAYLKAADRLSWQFLDTDLIPQKNLPSAGRFPIYNLNRQSSHHSHLQSISITHLALFQSPRYSVLDTKEFAQRNRLLCILVQYFQYFYNNF